MATYRVLTPLRNGGPDPVPPGETVELDGAEGDALAAIGAVEPTGDAAGDAPAPDKPLARMNKAELVAAAAAAGVELPDGATNAAIIAAIEAKRAEAGQ